jgi:hypothetical protein
MRIAVVLVGILLFSSYFLIAQVQEDIIKKHLKAIGGEKNWSRVKTMSTFGVRESGGDRIEERRQMILNKAVRIDYKYISRDPATAQKKYFIVVFDNKGWKYMPDNRMDTVELLSEQEVQYYKSENYFNDPFLHGELSQVRIEYLTKEIINDREQFKFVIHYAKSKSAFIYLDAQTYLITKSISIENDSEIELNYDEYKLLDKEIMIPHAIYSNYDGFSLKEVQLNPILSDEIFKPKALN